MRKVDMPKFQFHTGSIKSGIITLEPIPEPFQFHTGSIKRSSELNLTLEALMNGFNSILVRLKVKRDQTVKGYSVEFQFHTGSIKR